MFLSHYLQILHIPQDNFPNHASIIWLVSFLPVSNWLQFISVAERSSIVFIYSQCLYIKSVKVFTGESLVSGCRLCRTEM